MKQEKRISTIDCLRGLAAISVCFFHFVYGNSHYLPSDNYIKRIGSYGFLGVDIFFILSGFILPLSLEYSNYSLKNYFTFILKRLIRIDIPYLITILLCLALAYFSSISPLYKGLPFYIDYLGIALHIGYLTSIFGRSWINPVFWTLALEFQFYLLIAVFYPLLIKKGAYLYIFIALSLTGSYFIQTNNFIFSYLPFFCLGIVFFKFYRSYINVKTFLIITGCIYMFLLLKFDFTHFIASLIPLILFYKDNIANKTLLFLGKISYSMYLLHIPIGMRIINITDSLITDLTLKSFVVFFNILLVVYISYLFNRLVETPAMALSKKIVYKS
jgi:peptidoglycan/LPS O-acetylase OafA/YrhL